MKFLTMIFCFNNFLNFAFVEKLKKNFLIEIRLDEIFYNQNGNSYSYCD